MSARLLIAYGTNEGQTRHIAEELAAWLTERGVIVQVSDLAYKLADPVLFDGVVVGGSVHMGKYQDEVREFVMRNVVALNERPSWFFGVSLSEAGHAPNNDHAAAQAILDDFLATTGWGPVRALSVAGAMKYREYNFLKRMLMKRIAKQAGGDTDTSRDWEYTDWGALKEFANGIAETLKRPLPAKA